MYSVIKEEDTSRPFVPSSPSNGLDTIAEGWVAKDPQSTRYGDSELFHLLTCFYLATFFIISSNSSHSDALKTTPVPEPSLCHQLEHSPDDLNPSIIIITQVFYKTYQMHIIQKVNKDLEHTI